MPNANLQLITKKSIGINEAREMIYSKTDELGEKNYAIEI